MKTTEGSVTGAMARSLREAAGLSQSAFWAPLGVKQSVGCRYETEVEMPRSVRILLVTHYVCGLKIEADTELGVGGLARLASIQSNLQEAASLASCARSSLDTAAENIVAAREALGTI